MYDDVNRNDKKVLIALSPDYANIGDIAIYLAQVKLLNEVYPDRKIIEIPMFDFYEWIEELKRVLNEDDIITIIGGGNMGSVYKGAEVRRIDLVKCFPNNKIIGFPQSTSYYCKNDGDLYRLYLKIYDENKNITFFFREKLSYDIIRTKIRNETYLVPDMAMYLMNKIDFDKKIERSKIMLCFRNDIEKVTDNNIVSFISNLFSDDDVEIMDTYLGDFRVDLSKREEMFNNMINKFRESKIVITDRLHGMILALITKTPCIAFDNATKKISSSYDTWLKDIPYIRIVDNINGLEIKEMISELTSTDYDNYEINFDSEFDSLFDTLKNIEEE